MKELADIKKWQAKHTTDSQNASKTDWRNRQDQDLSSQDQKLHGIPKGEAGGTHRETPKDSKPRNQGLDHMELEH